MEAWEGAINGMMIGGIGIVIGSWLSMWLEPKNKKLNKIRIWLCGAVTVCAIIFVIKANVILPLLMIGQWPLLGLAVSTLVTYSAMVVVVEPVLSTWSWKFGVGVKALQDIAEEVSKKKEDGEEKEPTISDFKNNKSDIKGNEGKNLSERLMDEGEAYRVRTYMMSPTERRVFEALERDYSQYFHIFCQVRVVDIVQPNMKKHYSWSKEYKALFRQLSQWHFDYVICTKKDFRIKYAIELDDPSHERADRIKRDRILNQACETAGLNLIRVRLDDQNRLIQTYPTTEEGVNPRSAAQG
ncbi:DUF2726 domain-containing protein [Kushneria aurantia]|uniref:DUF2726 domain-containing protein n=1 Tax=Kushneria aurantia TaxID=504092 RepID=A0ABV6G3G5_9GAMM|nr:DUF2726 domain-containing protein [Kushneria aurantia]